MWFLRTIEMVNHTDERVGAFETLWENGGVKYCTEVHTENQIACLFSHRCTP